MDDPRLDGAGGVTAPPMTLSTIASLAQAVAVAVAKDSRRPGRRRRWATASSTSSSCSAHGRASASWSSVETDPFPLDPKTVDVNLPTASPLLTLGPENQKTRHPLRGDGPWCRREKCWCPGAERTGVKRERQRMESISVTPGGMTTPPRK